LDRKTSEGGRQQQADDLGKRDTGLAKREPAGRERATAPWLPPV